MLPLLPKRPKKPAANANVRLMPVVMATAAALLSVKAVAMAQSVAEAPHAADATSTATTAPDPAAPATSLANATAPAGAPAPACVGPSLAEQAGLSQSEVEVLQALQARREALDARASASDTESQLMVAAQQRLDQRLADLHQLEARVNGLLGQLDQAQEARLATLVDVYQRMRAKDAATVFNGLNDGVLVKVASRMRPQLLAEVMGHMDPARARTLTQMLNDQSAPPADPSSLLNSAQSVANAPGAPAAPPAGR